MKNRLTDGYWGGTKSLVVKRISAPVRGGCETDAMAGSPLSLDSLSSTCRTCMFCGRRLQRHRQLSRRRAARISQVRAPPSALSALSSSPLAMDVSKVSRRERI